MESDVWTVLEYVMRVLHLVLIALVIVVLHQFAHAVRDLGEMLRRALRVR